MKKEYLPYGNSKVGKACWECLKQLYKESEPLADIEKIIKSGEGKMEGFFMAYYLPEKRVDEIIFLQTRIKRKLSFYEQHEVSKAIFLGCVPNSCRETWKKARKGYKKKLNKFLTKL